MKYLVYSNVGYFIDIKEDITGVKHPYIEISDEIAKEIISKKENKFVVKVVNDEITYLKDINIKRTEIVEERDKILSSIIPYASSDWYRAKELPDATADEIADLQELYNRLLDMPQHYDASTDKQNWSWKWVEEYTSGKNTNTYQIKYLDFIKWQNN